MIFNTLVKSIVEPTLILFGFKLKKSIKGILEYDHDYLTVIMSYDYHSSYEVDATILFKDSDLFYGYDDLKECFGNGKFIPYSTQIKEENILVKWLEDVNEFFKTNLRSIIDNSKETQVRLKGIRQRKLDDYSIERDERLLREGVEKYWSVKDYYGLLEFLRKYNRKLKGSIKKKYEYALKMTKGG